MLRFIGLALLLAGALHGAPLVNDDWGFRTEVPDSMPAVKVDSARLPNTLHMFAEPERGGAVLQFLLLPDELPQGGETPSPRDATVNWKGHTLIRRQRALSPGTSHAGVEIYVDVPVARRGIRISLSGAARRETELLGLFMSVLERFDARTNWKAPGEAVSSGPPPPPALPSRANEVPENEGVSTTTAALAMMAALVFGFVAGWWMRGVGADRQPAPIVAPPVGLKVEAAKPAPKAPPAAAAAPKRAPDETDPGVAVVRCRVCGEVVREGRKKCMACGAEVY